MENYQPFKTTDNGKNASIVSYFWFIGWLIAYFAMYKNNETDLSRYQLRQTLLFHLCSTVVSWVLGILLIPLIFSTGVLGGVYLLRIIQLGFFVLWVIGLIGAVQGEKKPIPFIGEKAQTLFPGI
ncbi:DUF4870 domain-containing protein [Pedobacter agri]|uniref:DUF4870 domain-containing protein n=1 Tax=Pedobacter agri TaxID=454586 RepID=UPI00292F0BBA|nr:DUF4870 domain-containing protein [Pedobacter agri]